MQARLACLSEAGQARAYSQVPFWFWNDRLDRAELVRQMEDFQAHGIHAFVLHPRAGLPRDLGWMSEKLLAYMRFAIEEAARRDMGVFLYDEAMYPSGSSSGQVVAENPAFACRGLVQVDLTNATPGQRIENVRVGRDGIELDADQTLVAEVTRRHDGHRIAIVDGPIGSTIRGIHFVADDPGRRADHREVEENHPPAGDLLNPEAMKCFIRLVYQRFHDAFQPFFGTTIQAVFTDEPMLMGRGSKWGIRHPRPGTTGILAHVNHFLGDDFSPHLPALWDAAEPEAQQHRENYGRAIRHRLQETYYQPISAWCEAHGIALTGHPEKSDDIGMLRYFQIPGQDVVWRCIEPDKPSALEGAHSTNAKCASSAMLHAGRRRNLNEFAGAYGHDLTYAEYRWLALWLLVRGCNLLSPHAFYYSLRGPRLDERPRDVGPHSPWWNHYQTFAGLTGTLCWLNTDSEHLCDIAILGQEDRLPWKAARICFEHQIDFNYLEDCFLVEGSKLGEAGIEVGPMHYKLLIVEDGYTTTLGAAAEAQLARLAGVGRLVRWHPEQGPAALLARLAALAPSAVQVTPAHTGLRIRRVRKAAQTYTILFNECADAFVGTVSVGGISTGVLVDLDAACERDWGPDVRVTMAGHACVVLVNAPLPMPGSGDA